MAKKLGETLVDGRLVCRTRLGALWEGKTVRYSQTRCLGGIVTLAKYRRFSSQFGSAMRALRR